MISLNPLYYQYRSFDHLYVLKAKSPDSLAVKVFDVAKKCLHKQVIPLQALEATSIEQLFKKTDIPSLVETLVQQQLLPREHFPIEQMQITSETCAEALDHAIEQFKPKVFIEPREMQQFSCPITLEIFREPVIDEHGHTFEKEAIEEYLKSKNNCPINRQPIRSLTPNRAVQQAVEEWQRQDPIPCFSLFQKENLRLASSNLQMAREYEKECEYVEAINSYAKAFQYTKNWPDYVGLPSLFEKMGEVEKATLAYLYLALYQLKEGKTTEALQTLETSQKGKPPFVQIDLILIQLYQLANQPQKLCS